MRTAVTCSWSVVPGSSRNASGERPCSDAIIGIRVIATTSEISIANVIVSSKQLYASRYFESSFALTVFVEVASPGPSPASYLIYLNRSRTDLLGGLLGPAKRSIVEGGMVRGVKKTLLVTKDRLEKDFRDRLVTSSSEGARDPVPR